MKIKELIAKLQEYDPELDVVGRYSFINHTCGEECYCPSEEKVGEVSIEEQYIERGGKKKKPKMIDRIEIYRIIINCDF